MSTATFMFWQFLECIFEDKESRSEREKEREDDRKEREREREEAKKERDDFRRTMELIGYDIRTMTALTGMFPANFGNPEARMQLANHVPTESEVVQGVASEHRDPVEKLVEDIIADILDEVCGEDTSGERMLADRGRDVRVRATTSRNALNHRRAVQIEIEARARTENELRKRAGWTS